MYVCVHVSMCACMHVCVNEVLSTSVSTYQENRLHSAILGLFGGVGKHRKRQRRRGSRGSMFFFVIQQTLFKAVVLIHPESFDDQFCFGGGYFYVILGIGKSLPRNSKFTIIFF
jgi:hypothetical protein